jgi:hypothetical protein
LFNHLQKLFYLSAESTPGSLGGGRPLRALWASPRVPSANVQLPGGNEVCRGRGGRRSLVRKQLPCVRRRVVGSSCLVPCQGVGVFIVHARTAGVGGRPRCELGVTVSSVWGSRNPPYLLSFAFGVCVRVAAVGVPQTADVSPGCFQVFRISCVCGVVGVLMSSALSVRICWRMSSFGDFLAIV